MNPAQARDRAIFLATRETTAALKAARQIIDEWFACQALAWVARFAPEDQVGPIAQEALRVGRRAGDSYHVVGSAAWPLRALIERDHDGELRPILPDLIEQAGSIENPISRSQALFLVYQAVQPAGRKIWHGVFEAMIRASTPPVHWRQGRNLRDAILIAASEDPEFAVSACHSLRDERVRGQVERGLVDPRNQTARTFYWNDAR